MWILFNCYISYYYDYVLFFFLDTEKVYLSSITEVLRNHGKDYPTDLRVRVMGTIPINTATIIINELAMDIEPSDLLAEFYENQIVKMENVSFLPGLIHLVCAVNRQQIM